MKKIHCLNPISNVGLRELPENYQVHSDINQADAVLVRSAAMHETILNESVLAVARAGAGVNNIPLDDYAKKGVVVFNTPGANANAVKELVIAGMLLASRDIKGGMNWVDSNQNDPEIAKQVEKAKGQFGGTEIFNKTIGIFGLGAVGVLLANACHALGMKVFAVTKDLEYLKEVKLPEDLVILDTNEELFSKCDFISLNLPLIPETKHMINKTAFDQMKDGVIILNFARDGLVNDQDLMDAIQSKKVRKYVTDFPNEVTAKMEGVISIPHLGASTEEAEENCAVMAIHQVVDYLENGNIKNSVNYPNIQVGKKKSKTRVSILYDAAINLHEKLHPYFSKKEVVQCIDRKNNKYGCTIVDMNDDMSNELLETIRKIQGVIKIRVI
ncbi:MAG: 3-phosphoglycerate dehydrogenase [Tenericutes bacterium HGW-Tenericutes-2]|jgi:D-3-phosphoglycerate dehydrogenase|nr:MAG: 3-phosphoglycerate dehydrogenase [Tenericutes bacterium HGW-Tenericutes-2]